MTSTHPIPISTASSEEPTSAPGTAYLARPDGRIAYDVSGTGPLLVLVPGMGDLRGGYRFLAPALRGAGYRVACARNGTATAVQRLMLRVAMARPWAAISWKAYLPKLYAGRQPEDFAAYRARAPRAFAAPDMRKRSPPPRGPTTPQPSSASATSQPPPWC